MNILIINHYAGNPRIGMEFRPYYLAKEWVKIGHVVSIVGANYSHLRNHQPEVVKDLDEEIIDGIHYLWLRTPKYSSSGIMRVMNILFFVVKLLLFRNRIIQRTYPNIVISSSTYPFDIYPAYLISKKTKSKLVFELHDLWPLSPMIIGGYSQYHPFIWLMQKAENFACRNCNCYISVLGNAKEYLIHHGLDKEKFFHIPNGFSNDEMLSREVDIPKEHKNLILNLIKESYLIIGYVGGHAPSNALKSFVLAAARFDSNHKVAFILVGNGSQKNELIQITKQQNLKNVYFLPPISKSSISLLISQFDILYAGGISSRLHIYGTSFNKITDYMLAQKPIIFAVDEPNSLVEKVGCGIQIPAADEVELVKTINTLLYLSEEQRKEMGRRGREYALKELNYNSLAMKFLKAIEQF